MTPLTNLLGSRVHEGMVLSFEIGPEWLQGRTTFGGIVALCGTQAMRDVLGPELPLRAVQTSFVGPVGEGRLTVDVTVLRQGRNVTQVQARAHQAGEVAAVFLGTFGASRPSSLPAFQLQQPSAAKPAPDKRAATGPRAARDGLPAFLRHFDMHFAHGPLPYSGGHGTATQIYLRLRGSDALAVAPEMQAVLLGDLPPTPLVGNLAQRVPTSSVTWALELHDLPQTGSPDWWRMDCDTVAYQAGYANHMARLWGPDGRLAALSYQVVAIFG